VKKNLLILNNMGYHHIKNGIETIKESGLYNIYIISEKSFSQSIKEDAFIELISTDFEQEERLIELAKAFNIKFHKVIALSEKTQIIASKLRDIFDSDGMKYQDVLKFRDKYIMKSHIKGSGIRIPHFELIVSKEQIENLIDKYKIVVVKPRFGMGSKDTYIIPSKSELNNKWDIISRNLSYFIVEEFISGDLYHIDGIILGNSIKLFSTSKYLESTLNYDKDSYLSSIMIDDSTLNRSIYNFTNEVIKKFNIANNVIHLEIFVDNEHQLIFCELAIRIGGAAVVPTIENIFNTNLITSAIELEADLHDNVIHQQNNYGGWIIFYPKNGIVKNVSSIDDFQEFNWITRSRLFIKQGEECQNATMSVDAIASFCVSGNSSNEVETYLKIIKERFKYEVE
jgi:biotin carboxylase